MSRIYVPGWSASRAQREKAPERERERILTFSARGAFGGRFVSDPQYPWLHHPRWIRATNRGTPDGPRVVKRGWWSPRPQSGFSQLTIKNRDPLTCYTYSPGRFWNLESCASIPQKRWVFYKNSKGEYQPIKEWFSIFISRGWFRQPTHPHFIPLIYSPLSQFTPWLSSPTILSLFASPCRLRLLKPTNLLPSVCYCASSSGVIFQDGNTSLRNFSLSQFLRIRQ